MPGKIRYHRPAHLPSASASYERAPSRQADKHFYSSKPWLLLRAWKLRLFPCCEDCEREGRVELAAHVHHKEPRKARPDLALDPSNLESLCVACHNAKEKR